MSILESKKLKTRILLGYGAPLALLTLFAVTIGISLKLTSDSSNDLVRANRVIDHVRESVMATSRMVRSVRGAALFPTDPQYRESYKTGKERLDEAVTAMGDEIRDPQQKNSWTNLIKEMETLKTEGNEILQMIKAGQVAKAMPRLAEMDITAMDKTKDTLFQVTRHFCKEMLCGCNTKFKK
jgi:CHASE3 domain sensor protein